MEKLFSDLSLSSKARYLFQDALPVNSCYYPLQAAVSGLLVLVTALQ